MKITTRLFSTVIVLLLLSFTLGLIVAPSVLGLASVVDIGGTSGADINARYIAANQFQFNDTNILQIGINGTARYITFPNNTGTVVYRNSSDTLTNKILTSPTLTSPVISTSALFGSGTTLKVNSGGQPTFLTVTYGARVGALALNNSYPITGANLTAPIFSGTATTAGTFTMPAFTAGGIITLNSGSAVKVSGGGSPTLFTPTYGATTNTWAWNSSVTHTGLVLSGNMDAGAYSITNTDKIQGWAGVSSLVIAGSVTGGAPAQRDVLIRTGDAINPQNLVTRLTIGSNAATVDIDITNANLDLNGNSLIGIPNGSTGAGSAALGANSPAVTLTAPATWIPVTLANGTQVYIPAFK